MQEEVTDWRWSAAAPPLGLGQVVVVTAVTVVTVWRRSAAGPPLGLGQAVAEVAGQGVAVRLTQAGLHQREQGELETRTVKNLLLRYYRVDISVGMFVLANRALVRVSNQGRGVCYGNCCPGERVSRVGP